MYVFCSLFQPYKNIIRQDKQSKHHVFTQTDPNLVHHTYGARYGTSPIPKYRIASKVTLILVLLVPLTIISCVYL